MIKLGLTINKKLGGILSNELIKILNKLDGKMYDDIYIIDTEEEFKEMYINESVKFRDNTNNIPNTKPSLTRETYINIYNLYADPQSTLSIGKRCITYYSSGTKFEDKPIKPIYNNLGQFTVFITEKVTRDLGNMETVSQSINIFIK